MFDALIQALPPEWRPAGEFLLGLIAWIPEWQRAVIETVWWPGGPLQAMVATRVFILLPALLMVVGIWSTMVSVYTLPFRAHRGEYLRTLALTWWDAGRTVWLFWVGFARLTIVLLGWVWGTLRYGTLLLIRIARELVASPFAALDWTSRRYFKPGVPWLAFLLTVLWSAIEASIFTFTLRPTLSEVFYDLTGTATHPAVITPILFLFLFMLIAGSFASVQVLGEAVAGRKVKQIVQMVVIEFIVMFFEVFFLYRELVDAAVPWIAQQTGGEVRLGLFGTLAIACCGWIGIRAMTWFLFGRFGTPALLAVLSRQTITIEGADAAVAEPARHESGWWKGIIQDFKRERDWFQQKGRELADLAALPPLQVLAGAINFCLVVVLSQPVFSLPFKDLEEAMARLPLARERAESPARGRGLKAAAAPSEA
ncbi:MAG TPA: hypothetical protein VF188_09435 [Longimicrobiales bacterium]